MVAQPNYRPTMLHVRDAPRSASDVGYIMRILRILFALGARPRSLPPSLSLSLLGFTMRIMCARRCHELHHKYPHFVPLRAGIHFRLASHRLLFFSPSTATRGATPSAGNLKVINRHGMAAAPPASLRVAALVTLRRVFRSLEAFLALCCDRPTDRPSSTAVEWRGALCSGFKSAAAPRRGRCAPL